ncbi:MAG: hypothetical protein HZB25_11210 [Candidatus Eisenbacteria bacterium]|nr:hypothetical protein [Candidatus Eisenbacteria bacterium]
MNLLRAAVLGGALYLLPALALASWVRHGGALRRWGLALVLSPVALGVSVLPLRLAGLDSLQAGLVALGAWGVVAAWRGRELPGGFGAEETQALWRCAWLLPLVLVPPLLNPHLLERSDAWFHAAVTFQVRDLALPPQDPYYAGLPLQYFWFFHVVLATYDSVARVGPFAAMWLFNSAYFALALAGAYLLARRVGLSHAAALWAPGLAALGANAAGWGWVLVHAWKSPTGWAGLGAHLPDYVLNLVQWRYSSAALAYSLDKYQVGTAFSWGMTVFLWWALAAAETREERRPGTFLAAGALAAAALLVHTVAGFAVYVAGAVATVLAFLSAPSRGSLVRSAALALVMALGALAVMPYLRAVTQAKSDGGLPELLLNRGMVWTTLWVGVGVLSFAVAAAPAAWRAGGAARWTLLFVACGVTLGCVLRVNSGNEGKFLHLALLPAAALAAGAARAAFVRLLPGRVARGVALALAYGPTQALVLGCVLLSHGMAALRPDPPAPGPQELRLYEWVRRETPAEAVVLVAPGSLQALVRAERAQVWTRSAYAEQWKYPATAVASRRGAVEAAFGRGLGPGELRFLAGLERPVYRLSRDGEAPMQSCFVEARREGAWRAERLVLPEAR